VEPFRIHVADEVLNDLRARLRHTRWPDQIPSIDWEQGTELDWLRRIVSYWAHEFDWRRWERRLNAFNLSLPKMLSGANASEINDIERMNIGAYQPGVWHVTDYKRAPLFGVVLIVRGIPPAAASTGLQVCHLGHRPSALPRGLEDLA
jgi:hypothetical protein